MRCGLFLLIETRTKGAPTVSRFQEIVDRLEKVRSMLWEQSRRYHAIRVLDGVEKFVNERLIALTSAERTALIEYLGLMIRDLEQLPGDVQMDTGSEEIKNSVNRARERIIRTKHV